jgi:hypothetical protein
MLSPVGDVGEVREESLMEVIRYIHSGLSRQPGFGVSLCKLPCEDISFGSFLADNELESSFMLTV